MRGGSLAVRLIDALFVAANECLALRSLKRFRYALGGFIVWYSICCLKCSFFGIFMLQHNCQKICPTTALTAARRGTSMGCLQHAVIFIAVTHDACGPRPHPHPCPWPSLCLCLHLSVQCPVSSSSLTSVLLGLCSCFMAVTHIVQALWL